MVLTDPAAADRESDSDEGGEQFDIELGGQIDMDLTVPLEI
jgi:hypothetical protein